MPDKPENTINRRSFLNRTASMLAGTALGATAASYGRIVGANDRVSLGHIGIGSRGGELDWIVSRLRAKQNVEMTAVCDLWKVNRERAVLANKTYYGRPPRQFQYLEDLLLLKDVDAVLISTPEHSHSPILKLVAEAGKDAYVEKPMGNVLEEVKAARDLVLQKRRVVQVGTQHRSEPYPQAACELIQTGALGEVSKVEIVWNYHGPRWRGRPEVKQLRAEDTDWRKWLMTKPPRPFDPQLYFEFRLYKEFSSGIADQWMSHAIDLVHWFMAERYLRSVVAHGGIFAWRDGRQNPDTFQALLEYSKGFMVSYSTSFGNDAPSFTRYMGKKATLMNVGGEGSPRYKLVEEKGNHEDNPDIDQLRAEREVLLPGDKALPPGGMGDLDLHHMENWFECLRSRQQPHSTVSDGYAHSLACITAAQSFWAGKKLYYDPATETILDHPPAS
ncbi:MAG: Gfo/Idh/MocA family oxidoreductase [Terriglobia bacterium]|jgi:predicted dehydrogenase